MQNNTVTYLQERNFKAQQSNKHESYENAASQLQVVLGLIVTCDRQIKIGMNIKDGTNRLEVSNDNHFKDNLPSDGTPANKLLDSTLLSARTNNKAPMSAKLRNKN